MTREENHGNGQGAPARLVVRAPNWLGDAVLALPALRAVGRRFADSEVTLAATPAVAPLFAESVGLDGWSTLVLPDGRRAQVAALAAGRFDAGLLLTNSFGSAWALRRAAVPGRWGYRSDLRRWLLTRSVGRPRGRVHQADYYRSLVAGLGIEPDTGPPRLMVSDRTGRRAGEVLARVGWSGGPLVGLAPGAAYGHAKRWPPARAAELVARLVAEHDVSCVLLGARGDRDAGRAIESSLAGGRTARGRVLNLIGQTDLTQAMGVMARCRAFVSNDSGAMHVAAALGLPVTAIFGPTDERVTAPVGPHEVLVHQVFCRPCMLRECPIDHRCMKRITTDQVLAAVARQLGAGR